MALSSRTKWLGAEYGRLPKRGKIVNRAELARIFDVVPSSLYKYQEQGMPTAKKGRRGVPDLFDAADCLWWRIDYVTRQASRANDTDPMSIRKLRADTNLRQMKVDQRAANLVPVAWFLDVQQQAFAAVRNVLSSIAEKAAPLVAAETDANRCRTIIARVINEARERITECAIERKDGSLESE